MGYQPPQPRTCRAQQPSRAPRNQKEAAATWGMGNCRSPAGQHYWARRRGNCRSLEGRSRTRQKHNRRKRGQWRGQRPPTRTRRCQLQCSHEGSSHLRAAGEHNVTPAKNAEISKGFQCAHEGNGQGRAGSKAKNAQFSYQNYAHAASRHKRVQGKGAGRREHDGSPAKNARTPSGYQCAREGSSQGRAGGKSKNAQFSYQNCVHAPGRH